MSLLTSAATKHIAIIGGGVIGLCTALYASRRGHRVTVLDRAPAAALDGCSFGNMGMIVPSHFTPLAAPGMVALGLRWMWNPESPFYIRPRLDPELLRWGWHFWRAATRARVQRAAPLLLALSLASRDCFEELAAAFGDEIGLKRDGLLMLCKTPHALDEEAAVAKTARELGMPAEVLDVRQAAALDPAVKMDIAGAVYFPKDCHLSPARLMENLSRELARGSTSRMHDTDVTGWRLEGQRIAAVKTTRGDFEADEFVLCGGSWSSELVRELRLRLPLQAGRGYSLTLERPRQLPRIPAIFTEARVAVTPMGSSLRFGGTMEIAGTTAAINPRRVQGIIRSVSRYYPEFTPDDFANVKPWAGLRPCSPDGLPYVGRFRSLKNLSAATGHAMLGLSLGPITGKLMSAILSDEPPELDLSLLSPDRYA